MTCRAARGAAALLAIVLAAGVLAGCGGDDGNDAAEAVRAAPEKTVAAGSARVALDVSFPAGGSVGTVTGEGVIDLRGGRGALTLDLGGVANSFVSGPVDAVLDRSGIFVKLPPGVVSGSRPWLRIDLAALGQQPGLNIGTLGQLRSADPTQALEFLEGAVDDMDEVGSEEVRGAQTTHYRGTLDLDRAARDASPEAKEAVDQAATALGSSRIPADVWLDDEGRLRRMRFSVDADGGGPGAAGTVQVEMFDFGLPVDVEVPPANQVTDLSTVLGQPR